MLFCRRARRAAHERDEILSDAVTAPVGFANPQYAQAQLNNSLESEDNNRNGVLTISNNLTPDRRENVYDTLPKTSDDPMDSKPKLEEDYMDMSKGKELEPWEK